MSVFNIVYKLLSISAAAFCFVVWLYTHWGSDEALLVLGALTLWSYVHVDLVERIGKKDR